MEIAVGGGRRAGLAMPRFCCIVIEDNAGSGGGCTENENRLPAEFGTLKLGMVGGSGAPQETEPDVCHELLL